MAMDVLRTMTPNFRTAEEGQAQLDESFACPYCRAVSDLGDMMSVSVSPVLIGDGVLGPNEARRFLARKFTKNGLAIDAAGGVCTAWACPHCHMAVPRSLLTTKQIILSVVGAAGAGKSVFLASSMWTCRQVLSREFKMSFTDLDPLTNRWLNASEEKLFFQTDLTALQQIEKTDLTSPTVCRSVNLNGTSVLLPLPSFFSVRARGAKRASSLVVYDSAGEHFRAGADVASSAVTLNMLSADMLYFMFDPSADVRLASLVDGGSGTAANSSQRQDVILAEMAARIRRHMGQVGEARQKRPLIFGVSKADLLRKYIPLEGAMYREGALDMGAVRRVSEATENFLMDVVPEMVAAAHDLAEEVWFLPVSALGHNPIKEGVRPCDIHPVWPELPIVLTLAKKGLIPTID